MILSYLYLVKSVDFVLLIQYTGLTWGKLSVHIGKLKLVGYIEVKKEFVNKNPNPMISITGLGRNEFDKYRRHMKGIYDKFLSE